MRVGLFLLLCGLSACLASSQDYQDGGRVLVKADPALQESIARRAALEEGLSLIARGHGGLLVLQAGPRASGDRLKASIARLSGWEGVQHAEADRPRFLHRPLRAGQRRAAAPGPQSRLPPEPEPEAAVARQEDGQDNEWGDYVDCSERDMPLSNASVLPEFRPYGLEMVQATSSKVPNRTDDAGVVICVIDSGLDVGHADIAGNVIDGCKYQDAFAPAGCPFLFGGDVVGHGTHITGTIAAQANGRGVVGVIPGPAEIYVVRVFNSTGDVNQGEGLVYGSSLILAFTQCEGRLAAQQAAHPEKNYRMVVSMSLGAAGPLTIERMFFREAYQRGDVLFVASSGNNATAPTLVDGRLSTDVNPGNYPGAYPEVIAVSAVDCRGRLAPFSQKNPAVDLAAPGVRVLSSSPRDSPRVAGAVGGGFATSDRRVVVPAGIAGKGNSVRFAGVGTVDGKVADCGTGDRPCPAAKGNICLVQYDPGLRNITIPVTLGPAPRGPGPNISPLLGVGAPLAFTSAAAAPPQGGNGGQPAAQQVLVPTRFLCDAMEFCMEQGAAAVLLAPPLLDARAFGDVASPPPDLTDQPLQASLNCSMFNCSCWDRIANKTRPPAVGMSLRQYAQLKDELEAAAGANDTVTGTVATQLDAFLRLSGTSMAVPHVTGGIARVWAAFPSCSAAEVREAFEETAADLGPKGKDVMFGNGLVQIEAAYDYLLRQPCSASQQRRAAADGAEQESEADAGGAPDPRFEPSLASPRPAVPRQAASPGPVPAASPQPTAAAASPAPAASASPKPTPAASPRPGGPASPNPAPAASPKPTPAAAPPAASAAAGAAAPLKPAPLASPAPAAAQKPPPAPQKAP